MKRYISLFVCLFVLVSLCGCHKETTIKTPKKNVEVSKVTKPKQETQEEKQKEETKQEEEKKTEETQKQETETKKQTNSQKTKKQETTTEVSEPETTTSSSQKVIAIDAGHQKRGNNALEPIGPGAKEKKAKVTTGTSGVNTRIPESEVNLAVAKKLQAILKKRGYKVVMIRTSQNVNLSNKQRADIANNAHADAFIRIHADGATSASAKGATTLAPASNNPYLSKTTIQASQKLSKSVLTAFCQATGAKNRGVSKVNNMSGINWCKVPVCLLEMGFLTNPEEDKLLTSDAYQNKCAKGIANGIDAYFNN